MGFVAASLVGAAEARAWRPQRHVWGSPQRASVCPAASAASGPEQAASGSLSDRGRDPFPPDVAEERSGALCLPGVRDRHRSPRSPPRPAPRPRAAACDVAGSSSLLLAPDARWPLPPSSRRKGCPVAARGLRDPPDRSHAPWLLPLGRGGHQPLTLAGSP